MPSSELLLWPSDISEVHKDALVLRVPEKLDFSKKQTFDVIRRGIRVRNPVEGERDSGMISNGSPLRPV